MKITVEYDEDLDGKYRKKCSFLFPDDIDFVDFMEEMKKIPYMVGYNPKTIEEYFEDE